MGPATQSWSLVKARRRGENKSYESHSNHSLNPHPPSCINNLFTYIKSHFYTTHLFYIFSPRLYYDYYLRTLFLSGESHMTAYSICMYIFIYMQTSEVLRY